MSDQCKNCTVKGDVKKCLATECHQHENWMAKQQRAKIAELKEVAEAMRDWILAVPTDTVLPAMPGFDWDWAMTVVESQGTYASVEFDPYLEGINPMADEEVVELGTTNDDKPFEAGEMIEFEAEEYEVICNFGDKGNVKRKGEVEILYNFVWDCGSFGFVCRRVVK